MPSASEATATAVNPGRRASSRTPCLRSCNSSPIRPPQRPNDARPPEVSTSGSADGDGPPAHESEPHQILTPNDLAGELLPHLRQDPLANLRRVDLREDVAQHQGLH